jgi:hypothetical protein
LHIPIPSDKGLHTAIARKHISYETKNVKFIEYFLKLFFERDVAEIENLCKEAAEKNVGDSYELIDLLPEE